LWTPQRRGPCRIRAGNRAVQNDPAGAIKRNVMAGPNSADGIHFSYDH
jgi:hypothetical protein